MKIKFKNSGTMSGHTMVSVLLIIVVLAVLSAIAMPMLCGPMASQF